jgi:hypothetical protein
VAGLTFVAARDLGRYGVTVNCIAPGAATRLTATVPETAQQLRAQAGIASAGQRPSAQADPDMRSPAMVAPMTIYLLLDDAWNINGKIFQVSGGSISLLQDLYPPFRTIFKPGRWTLEELRQHVPAQLMADVANPAPPRDDLTIPGRDA